MASDIAAILVGLDDVIGRTAEEDRKAGITVINHVPEADWSRVLEMLGLKSYTPKYYRHNGYMYETATRKKVVT